MSNYFECVEYLSSQYDEVNGYDFYHDIFPDNQSKGDNERDSRLQPNAIYLYKNDLEDESFKRRIMLKDTWEDDYIEHVERKPMTLCSGLSYLGKRNLGDMATTMSALIFDLDNVGLNQIRSLFFFFGGNPNEWRRLPIPTYVVASGSGVHVYYVFTEPIVLYPNIKLQLKQLKYDLTFTMWNYGATTREKRIQYQPITQGFRMVGSVNTNYHDGVEVKAFRTGDKVTIDYLNQYVKEENRVDVNRPFRPSQITKAEAAKEYPEWYHRKFVLREKYKRHVPAWNGDKAYYWWLNNKLSSAIAGHRYFYMMCLAIFAYKCGISKEQLEKDIRTAFNYLRDIEHKKEEEKNELTQFDIDSALDAYGGDYHCFKREDMEKLSAIDMTPKIQRRGRKQEVHLEIARANKEVLKRVGEMKREGRPSAQLTVKEYREKCPDAKKIDCHRDTGLSRPTIQKWWEQEEVSL